MRNFGLCVISAVVAGILVACGGTSSDTTGTTGAAAATTAPKASGGITGDPAKGQALFTTGANGAPACITCHYVDASKGQLVGPNQSDIAIRAEQRIKDPNYHGQAKTVAEYLKESIVTPNVYVVEGFQPNVMYQNYSKDYSDAQINDLVAYLLTLRGGK